MTLRTLPRPYLLAPFKGLPLVYFLQQGEAGPIKIGTTLDLGHRFKGLTGGNPWPLLLRGIRVFPFADSARSAEKKLHRALVAARIHGEWFNPTAAVMTAVLDNSFFFDPARERARIKKTRVRRAQQLWRARRTKPRMYVVVENRGELPIYALSPAGQWLFTQAQIGWLLRLTPAEVVVLPTAEPQLAPGEAPLTQSFYNLYECENALKALKKKTG